MASYEYNEESAAFEGGRIEKTGAYVGHLANVYAIVSSGGAEGVRFEAVASNGSTASFDVWTVSKAGQPIARGETVINGLMAILGLKGLSEKPGHSADVYDFDLRAMKTIKVIGYPKAIMKPIGFCLQREWNNYTSNNGEAKARLQNSFVQWFDAETRQTPKEKIKGEEAVWVNQWLDDAPDVKGEDKSHETAHVIKQAQSAPNAPVVDPFDMANDFDDDIPF